MKKNRASLNDKRVIIIMLAPLLILLSIFVVIPLIYAAVVSFYEWSFYQDSVFIGLENFRRVLVDPKFYSAILTGLKFALIVVPTQLILSFLFASAIKSMSKKVGGFMKTSIYVPNVISGVVASTIFIFIYDFDGGIANAIATKLGFEQIAWLSDIKLALGSIAVPAIWIGFGMTTLVMLAGLNDIPNEYYEAAELDSANWFQKTIYITLPMMKNVFLYLLVMGFTGAMQQFDLPFMMTNGGPVSSTMTPNLFIFNHFKSDPYMGYTIAAALILFVILGTISFVFFRVFNRKEQ